MEPADFLPYLGWIIGGGFVLGAMGILASFQTTRMKIKNGYPLEGMWGQSLKPGSDAANAQRVTLLTQENAELRAANVELGFSQIEGPHGQCRADRHIDGGYQASAPRSMRCARAELQREVEALRERIQVLERIATEDREVKRLASDIERCGTNRKREGMMSEQLLLASASLLGLVILAAAMLKGWQDWLALKERELERRISPRDADGGSRRPDHPNDTSGSRSPTSRNASASWKRSPTEWTSRLPEMAFRRGGFAGVTR
jgi:hypothetical protein